MPISKEAAHARAVKAAATRAANRAATGSMTRAEAKAAGKIPPAFPRTYHGAATRHVTRDLRMKQTIKKPKQTRIAIRAIRKASTAELTSAFDHMNSGSWVWGAGDDKRYYAIKDELRARASGNTALFYQRVGARTIGDKKVGKRQIKRVSTTRKRR